MLDQNISQPSPPTVIIAPWFWFPSLEQNNVIAPFVTSGHNVMAGLVRVFFCVCEKETLFLLSVVKMF